MSSEGLHAPRERLSKETISLHQAITSLIEELEAIDWYDQRVRATRDPALATILAHNRDDEKEHAAMTLEWIRRQDPALEEQLRRYLFTSGAIVSAEGEGAAAPSSAPPSGSLGIGSLRGVS